MSTGAVADEVVGSGAAAMEYDRFREAVLVEGVALTVALGTVGGVASTTEVAPPTRPITLSEITALEAVGGVTMAGAAGVVP